MREILFRGKTEKGEWVYGDLLHPDNCGNGYSIEDFTKEKNNCFDVIPSTIGQYTGLTDKNGKRIFEGDIVVVDLVHFPTQKGVVTYTKDFFGLDIKDVTPVQHCIDYAIRNGQVEIIGNIHDNPELLET